MLSIIYVGPLNEGGTCLQRFNALKELGNYVIGIDSHFYLNQLAILKKIIKLLKFEIDILRINKKVAKAISTSEFDILWVDKGIEIKANTLKKIKESYSQLKIVNYNPDDPFGRYRNNWGEFLKSLAFYDINFVPRRINISEYKLNAANNVIQMIPFWGYDPGLHRPMEVSEEDKRRLGGDVGFIGDYEEEREHYCFSLAKAGIRVRVWGPNWKKKSKMNHKNLTIENTGLWGIDYVKAICAFKINLCFLRKANRDLHTSRSIEIPACGGFMLAERTSEHQFLFSEGKEAEYFDNDDELLNKTIYFLNNENERLKIAKAGYDRCITSGYSYKAILTKIINCITSI